MYFISEIQKFRIMYSYDSNEFKKANNIIGNNVSAPITNYENKIIPFFITPFE